MELTPQPIQDDEHNTLTFAKTLWFNPAQSELGLMGLSFTGSTDGTLTEHRSVSELLIGTGSFPSAEALEAKLQPSPLHRCNPVRFRKKDRTSARFFFTERSRPDSATENCHRLNESRHHQSRRLGRRWNCARQILPARRTLRMQPPASTRTPRSS